MVNGVLRLEPYVSEYNRLKEQELVYQNYAAQKQTCREAMELLRKLLIELGAGTHA